jgi:putative flippase GtrA
VNQSVKQFASFVKVGFAATAAHYVMLAALVELLSVNEVFASTLGYAVGAVVSYTLNYRFTFNSDRPHQIAVSRFFVIALTGMALNSLAIAFLLHNLAVHYFVAQIAATGFVLLWNFVGNRYWTF